MLANFCIQLRHIRLVLCALVPILTATAVWAHPMGNFSVSHYSRIDVQSQKIVIHYFIDLAEIPAYQELQQANIEATPNSTIDPSSSAILHLIANRGAELGTGLSLRLDGKSTTLRLVSSGVIFPPGAGGLPTMKMGFVYEAVYPPAIDRAHVRVDYADNNYQGHSGWKEIVAISSAGKLIASSVPVTDRSNELSNYPTDLLSSPPQALEATLQASLPAVPPAITAGKSVPAVGLQADPQHRRPDNAASRPGDSVHRYRRSSSSPGSEHTTSKRACHPKGRSRQYTCHGGYTLVASRQSTENPT